MQKSLDIFKAEPQSVFDVLCEKKNTGFYMPAYQRPYSWEGKHICDLFSDCENVFKNLLQSSDAIIFLGTLLTVDDSGAKTVHPKSKTAQQTPVHIKLVIDGQQRLTTLILIMMCLNERLNILLPKLKKVLAKEGNEEFSSALENLREMVSGAILDTSNFVIETQADDDLYKYLPKVTRAYVDCWGKKSKIATYASPIADVIISYQRHVIDQKKSNVFAALDLTKLGVSSKRVVDNVKDIRKQLDLVENGFDHKDGDFLTIDSFVNNETLEQSIDFIIGEELLQLSHDLKDIKSIIFITGFAKFLLHRVCLTYVEVNSESYAFDMFEALNTTGEPLTAIETFVPRVIEHIGNKMPATESACEDVETIQNMLNSITTRFEPILKTKEKNDAARSLILVFVRAYQGKVKVTSLRDQRDAMLNSYDSCKDYEKDLYLNYLKRTADFIFDYWQMEKPDLKDVVSHEHLEHANLCLHYLKDIKHEITQSLLVQFMLLDDTYGVKDNLPEALKAVTAFSVLWRAMSGGADGIDAVYKKLHEVGFDGLIDNPYQLRSGIVSIEKFDLVKIKKLFKEVLINKINTKGSPKVGDFEQWLDICSKQPILTKSKNIKFLLLAGLHHIELDGCDFVRKPIKRNDFLTTTMWDLMANEDRITFVYDPANKGNADWPDEIAETEVFNRLGNVLIDAKPDQKRAKVQSWYSLRQNLLTAQKNDSIEHIDVILSANIEEKILRSTSVLMLERKYADITHFEKWNEEAINARTEALLRNAWVNMMAWLD